MLDKCIAKLEAAEAKAAEKAAAAEKKAAEKAAEKERKAAEKAAARAAKAAELAASRQLKWTVGRCNGGVWGRQMAWAMALDHRQGGYPQSTYLPGRATRQP